MIELTIRHVKRMHQQILETTGGMTGIREEGTLESAIYKAFATFDGNDLYPTTIEKAATTCFSIISNHPFFDGNKRTGIFVMLVLLELNDIHLSYSQEELVSLGLGIASGEIKNTDICDWINKHLDSIE